MNTQKPENPSDQGRPRRDPEPEPQTLIQSAEARGESAQLSIPEPVTQHQDAPDVPGYILRERMGEGAFGQVWRAWQVRTRKEVAVKVFGHTSGLDWVFLQREVERLTRLDRHPHIVTVLDTNLTATPPFYAMDLIEGGSLQQFVDPQRRAPMHRVLRWQEQLCEALQYVHAKGLLHCDLKPANILIDEQDNVRVCDFGQSRLFSEAGVSFGTLFYMAPEQATLVREGQSVQPDVRWDIYGLGATLYAVLTGTVPRGTPENTALLESSCELDEKLAAYRGLCRTPIFAHAVGSGSGGVNPELSAVVAMCMAPEAADRYKTMAGVLRDVAAIRECRPVSPLAASWRYRAKKLLQRNPWRLGLAAALLLSLVGFAVNSEVQANRIARERDKAVATAKYIIDVFKNPDPTRALGKEITAEDILDQGAAKIETELSAQPALRASLMEIMGASYRNLGIYDKAEPLLLSALDIRENTLGVVDGELADTIGSLASVYRLQHDGDKAAEYARRALSLRRDLHGEEHLEVADALHLLGIALEEASELGEAESCLRESIAMRRRLQGDRSEAFAQSLLKLGRVLILLQKMDEGKRVITEALEIRRAELDGYHPAIAATLNELAGLFWALQKYERVVEVMREALEISSKVLKPDHPIILDRMNNLARALSAQEKYEEAEELMLEVLRIRRQRFGGDENVHVANSLNLLAEHYLDTGDLSRARESFEQALEIRRKVLKPGHPHIGTTLMNLGDVLQEQGDAAAALPRYRETLENWSTKLPPGHRRLADIKSRLGGCLVALGELEEAEPLLSGSFAMIQEYYGDDDSETIQALHRLIALYEARSMPEAANRYRKMLPAKETQESR